MGRLNEATNWLSRHLNSEARLVLEAAGQGESSMTDLRDMLALYTMEKSA